MFRFQICTAIITLLLYVALYFVDEIAEHVSSDANRSVATVTIVVLIVAAVMTVDFAYSVVLLVGVCKVRVVEIIFCSR